MQPRTLGTTPRSRKVQARFIRLTRSNCRVPSDDSGFYMAVWFACTLLTVFIGGAIGMIVKAITGSVAAHVILTIIGGAVPTVAVICYGIYRCGEWVRFRHTTKQRRRFLASGELLCLEGDILDTWNFHGRNVDTERADIEQFPQVVTKLGELQAARDSELTSHEQKQWLNEKISKVIREALAPILAEHQALRDFQMRADELEKRADIREHNQLLDRLLGE